MSERAQRLGAAMLLFRLVREPATVALNATAELPLLDAEEWGAWREADDEDVRLAQAWLNTEFELRDRQWQALAFLLYVRTAPEAVLPTAPSTLPGRDSATTSAATRGGSEPEPMITPLARTSWPSPSWRSAGSKARGAGVGVEVGSSSGPPARGRDPAPARRALRNLTQPRPLLAKAYRIAHVGAQPEPTEC